MMVGTQLAVIAPPSISRKYELFRICFWFMEDKKNELSANAPPVETNV